jgi:hypothetical protein
MPVIERLTYGFAAPFGGVAGSPGMIAILAIRRNFDFSLDARLAPP